MSHRIIMQCLFGAAGLLLIAGCASADEAAQRKGPAMGDLLAVDLRCEDQVNPLAVGVDAPRLSWRLEAARAGDRGQRQTAYRVLCATAPDLLQREEGDLWDSGRVEGAETLDVAYAGEPQPVSARVWWSVRVWDRYGAASAWSAPAWWERGPRGGEWAAAWIASPEPLPEDPEELYGDHPAPLFRHKFRVEKPVARARAYVSGLGYHELRLNGEKVGDHELDPAWTDYTDRVFYSVFDVTGLLTPGENAAGLVAGNGWWNPLPLPMWRRINIREALPHGAPCVTLVLDIEYEDGALQRVATGPGWKTAPSPILRNSVYLGELYDARREQPGWDAPGFDDSDWEDAVAVGGAGPLEPQYIPPIRVTEEVQPRSMVEIAPGTYVFDFGKNMAGRARLRVAGPAGTRVQVRYGELLYPDGALNPMTAVCGQIKEYPVPEGSERPSTAEQKDVYILRGEGVETWGPRFTFHAFRYVEVTGWPGEPDPDSIVAERLHTDVESSGTFVCSEPLFNAIQEVTRNTFLGNLHGVQSDCPGREKFQYGGDIVATADAFLYNFDMRAQYAKTARDHADAQRDNGGFTETAPFVGIYDASLGGESGPIGWGTAHPLLVDHLYRWYGNRALAVEQYPRVKRWADFLAAQAVDGILDNGLGDHETIAEKDTAVSGTAFYIYNMHMAANLARIAGDGKGARRFDALCAEASAAFEQRLYDAKTGRFGNGTQASQAFGLALGLPAVDQAKAVAALLADIAANGNHLTTGIFGTKYLLDVLSALGHGETAAAIAAQRDMPSWGYMLDQGATTLWEHWAGSDNTFSQNHPMFGSVSAWFFARILGLRPAPDAVGFDRVIVQPGVESGLQWARGEYRSVRGPIRVYWENRDGRLRLDLTLPPGVAAEVRLPGTDLAAVFEDDTPVSGAPGISVASVDGGHTVLHAESGAYRFQAGEKGNE